MMSRVCIFLCVVLSVLGAGCITGSQISLTDHLQPETYHLTYDSTVGDTFTYNVTSTVEEPKTTVLTHILTVVSDIERDSIVLQSLSTTFAGENTVEQSYSIKLAPNGSLIESNSILPILPEVQPEVPNLLVFPEHGIQDGDSWSKSFDRRGNATSDEGTVEYHATGTVVLTCLGLKKVSVNAGEFVCVGFEEMVNFSINQILTTENGTFPTFTSGEISGINWVDKDSGFLIESTHKINRTMKIDFSTQMNTLMGFEKFYQEIPVQSQIHIELDERSRDLNELSQ